MARASVLAVLGLLGCGRLGFGAMPPADGARDDGAIDAPPTPVSICKVDRVPLSSVPQVADLAIAGTAEGYAAIWVDTTGGSPAHGVRLGPNHQVLGSVDLPGLTATQLGGIADAGQQLVLASATGGAETIWIVGRDLTTMTPTLLGGAHVMGHAPFPSSATLPKRAFLTGVGAELDMAYVASDGTINPASSAFAVDGPVTELTCTDGPNHAHCMWSESLTGPPSQSQCSASDITLGPNTPSIGSRGVISSDCHGIRNASGPVAADSMLVVWVTGAGTIEAQYLVSTGVVPGTIAVAGSAPKVQFDGTRFWIAWLDGGGELRLTSFELGGTMVHYELPGRHPSGPDAFQVVNRGNETALVLLLPDGLEFLTICT